MEGIISVSAGGFFSLILDKDGRVYSFGSNIGITDSGDDTYFNANYGLLGLNMEILRSIWENTRNEPVPIPNLNNIIQISAGSDHSLVLNDGGKVYSFGGGYNGQLGLSRSIIETPTLIPSLNNIISISAGDEHSLVLDENNKVHSFGLGTEGELGYVLHPESRGKGSVAVMENSVSIPKIIDRFDNIIQISAGRKQSMLLNRNGQAYLIGFISNNPWINETAKEEKMGNIKEIDTHNNNALLLDNKGNVYFIGTIFQGLGEGNMRDEVYPNIIPNFNIYS